MVAVHHYLQTPDAHFDHAAGIGGAAANPATYTRPTAPKGEQRKTQNPHNPADSVGVGVRCNPVEIEQVTPRGFEPLFPG